MTAPKDESVATAARFLGRPELYLALLFFAGLAYRLQRAWEEIPTLVLKVTADDAYYYFQIARNLANGNDVTFDGETLTNGFHPLWLALLTPVYFFTDDLDLAVHVGLTIAAVLGAATIVFTFLIGRELTGNAWAALLGAAFFALHPYIVVESINGMETAVAVLTMSMTIWLFLRLARMDSANIGDYALFGIAGGLMVLGRTDSIIVLAAMGLYLFIRDARRLSWSGPLLAGFVAFLVVAPWLIWNLVALGTVVQVSGVAVPEYNREVFLYWNGDDLSTQLERSWEVTKQELLTELVHKYFVFPLTQGRTLFLVSTAAALAFMLLAPLTPQRQRATGQIGLLAVPALGVLAMLLFHSVIRWHLREWYYGPVTIIASTFIAVGVAYIHSALSGTTIGWGSSDRELRVRGDYRWVPFVALYGAVAVVLLAVYGPWQSERWVDRRALPHRLNMLEGAYWLRDNTDDDARVSAINAGIFGYFSERDVTNLDGVVNEDAFHARLDCRTSNYIAEVRSEYLVDVEMSDGFGTLDSLRVLPCGKEPCLTFQELAEVGRTLGYFGGGQVDVLRLTGTEGCRGPVLTGSEAG